MRSPPLALLIALAGCGTDLPAGLLDGEAPFVAIPRDRVGVSAHAALLTPGGRGVSTIAEALGTSDLPLTGDGESAFYLAIHKKALGQRWFLSAYLKQYFPGAVAYGAARSLGTRVVSFKVQNGKLFVFDVDDRHKTSDTFTPDLIVDAYPLVDLATFHDLPGSDRYVLFDPAAGLNRFGVIGDYFGANSPIQKFAVELSFLQRFRQITDGVTFEQVFTGYGDRDYYSGNYGEPNQFRGSGTLGIGLRRYVESADFKPFPLPQKELYFRGQPTLVPNTGQTKQFAIKWNIKPGMKPIRWVMSHQFEEIQALPVLKDYDVVGAVRQGIEGWNQVFGFPALEAVLGKPGDSYADDDVNYLILDKDPSYGAAFANWRLNPNTSEIRGASVYFNMVWFLNANSNFKDDVGLGPAPPKEQKREHLPRPVAPGLVWQAMPEQPLCVLFAPAFQEVLSDGDAPGGGGVELTKKQKVERFVTHVIAHEIGHTLGLRHNFKGSLTPPSTTVMEYVADELRAQVSDPGSYDTEAIRYLYGLSDKAPASPFCTDEETSYDVDCTRFDETSDPLTQFYGPLYTGFVSDYLTGKSGTAPNSSMNNLLKYLRASSNPASRLQAWATAIDPLRVPVPAARLAAYPGYGAAVDTLTRNLFARLYLDSSGYRGTFSADPPQTDLALQALILGELKANLLNLDQVRSFPTRRVCVDVLKKQQTLVAYSALVEARATIAAGRNGLTGTEAVLTDDLLARIDAATHPYFTN
ncbi:MAG: hypothetical protein EXR72_02140 [Myxococcales bacterium]|nr:hypothetical protein [Myxococcales bacterium]